MSGAPLLDQLEAFLRRALKARTSDGGARVQLLERDSTTNLESELLLTNVPPGLAKGHDGLKNVAMALLSHAQSYGNVRNAFVVRLADTQAEHVFQIRRAA